MARGAIRRLRTGAAACLMAGFLAACSGPSGQRVLTFFFDGVPPRQALGPGRGQPGGPVPGGVVPARREHGPYAAKLCDGCHEAGRGNALVLPKNRLCGRCHVLGGGKRYVHGPLNAGGCLVCHDPHTSRNPYLLVSASAEFCVRCHDRRALRAVEGHDGTDGPCTTCHEAHMSDRPFLLR